MNTRFTITATLILSLAGVTLQSAEPPPTPLVTQPAAHWIAVLESDAAREEKAVACRQLAVNGTRAAVPELVKLLENQELSHMARYALETMPGVDGALRDQLKTLQGLPLAGVIASIGVRGDAKAVKPIAALLDSSDLTVARAAARALGNIGTPAAADALGKGMASANAAALPALYDGWLKCAEKLAARKPKQSLAIYDELLAKDNLPGHVRGAAVRGGIVSRGETDTAFLRQSLLSEDGTVFAAALGASSEVAGPAVTLILEEVFWLSEADRRVALVERLGMRGGVEGVAALAKAGTEGGGAAVREAAVRALGSIGKASLPLLFGFAQSAQAGIARTACEALAGIPGEEADAVVLQLAQKGAQKRAGIELIGRRRMSGAVPVLVTFLGDADGRVRLAAVQRIGELGGAHEAVKVLDFMHGTKDARELDAAAEALSSICIRSGRPEGTLNQVAWHLNRAEGAECIALLKAASVIAGPKALDSVSRKVSDRDGEVRLAAVRALAEWPDMTAAPALVKVLGAPATKPVEHSLAFRGYTRLVQNSAESPEKKLELLSSVSKEARSVDGKKLLLAALGDIVSAKALGLVAVHLSEPELTDDAAAAAVRIAGRLDGKFKLEIGAALNQVLQAAKSEPVLEKARQRMQQLGIAVTRP